MNEEENVVTQSNEDITNDATETVPANEENLNNEQANSTEEVNTESVEGTEQTENTQEVSEGEPTSESLFTEKDVLEKFGNIAESFDNLVQLAKEGLEHRKAVIETALSSGVHSMGNSFNKEIFEKTFANMSTKDIEAMGKAWEDQATDKFVKNKVSKQDFSNDEKNEMKRIDMKQFKTSNY